MIALAMLPVCAAAQKTESEIKARLVGKALYLRGQWSKDKLEFDPDGHLTATVPTGPFTLSGIEITGVKLRSKELEVDGQRLGMVFPKNVRTWVRLKVGKTWGDAAPELIAIHIKTPGDADYTAALDTVFANNISGLDMPLPFFWQAYVQKNMLPVTAGPSQQGSPTHEAAAPRMSRIDGGVTAPQLLTSAEPEFDEAARAMKFAGIVTVNLVVGTDGTPEGVRVLRPAGLGLDEQAVKSVEQYKFKPAMMDGKPVPVEMNVEVNFQIF